MTTLLQRFIAARPCGFVTAVECRELATMDRLLQVLVRCGGCRFVCAVQDVPSMIRNVEAGGDYVRDVAVVATVWREAVKAVEYENANPPRVTVLGRVFKLVRTANGAQDFMPLDGGEVSAKEWEAYCDIVRQAASKRPDGWIPAMPSRVPAIQPAAKVPSMRTTVAACSTVTASQVTRTADFDSSTLPHVWRKLGAITH